MNVQELQIKLTELGVPQSFYSINGCLSSNTYILNHVYNYWEYFYFDEKGRRTDYRKFDCECDACQYFYNELKFEMMYYRPPKNDL